MQKTPTKIHRTVVFIGLAAAIVLCAFSCIALGRVRPPRARPPRAGSSIEELDALANPHFDEAERNVPSVVADLTSQSNFLKLCCLMVEDKLSGSEKTQKFIESKIHARIESPARVAERRWRHEEVATVAAGGGSVRQPLRHTGASPETARKDSAYPSGESLPQAEDPIPAVESRRCRRCGGRYRHRLVQGEQRRGGRNKDRRQRAPGGVFQHSIGADLAVTLGTADPDVRIGMVALEKVSGE